MLLTGDDGVGLGGGLLFYSSVPQSYFDIFSYHILLSSLFFSPSVHQSYFDIFSYSILLSSSSVPQSYFDDISYYILFSFPFVLHEITSFCSLLFGFRRTQFIPELGLFYNEEGILLGG